MLSEMPEKEDSRTETEGEDEMKLRYLKCIFLGCKRTKHFAYCVRCGFVVLYPLRKRIRRYIQKGH